MIAEGLTNETAIREGIRKEAAEDGKVLTLEQEQDLYLKAVQKIADISRICAGTISLAIGLDVSSTVVGATVAVENDYKPQTLDKLTTELVARDLEEKGYAAQEAREAAQQVDEIAQELAAADQEMAAAEAKAAKKIQARQQIKQAVKETETSRSEATQVEVDLIGKTTLVEPSHEYQDIMIELAHEKQQIAAKHQEALASRSWHQGVREVAIAAREILTEATVYAVNKALDDFSYIPNPIGTAAVAISETRDVYNGTKTLGEATFDLAMGAVVGKGVQLGGKALIQGAKTIAKPLVEKSKSALGTFTDYVSSKIGKGGQTNVQFTTKMNLLPSPKMADHHIFPQQFRKYFEEKGINIHDYTISVGESTHLKGIHGTGNAGMPGGWNKRWSQFINSKPEASTKDIYQFAGSLLDEYNLNKLNIHGYKNGL